MNIKRELEYKNIISGVKHTISENIKNYWMRLTTESTWQKISELVDIKMECIQTERKRKKAGGKQIKAAMI